MKTLIRAILTGILIAGCLAAAANAGGETERPVITWWGEVQFDYSGKDCAEFYTQYIEPCEGCQVWIDWGSQAIFEDEGGPVRIEGTITDIPLEGARVPEMCQVLTPSLVQSCD